jgi:hypothetical protein
MKKSMTHTPGRGFCLAGSFGLALAACQSAPVQAPEETLLAPLTVADTPTDARAPDGLYISWREHLIDDEQVNGGIPIRGGDGLAMADIDGDGYMDIVSVHEDSNHLRIAFGTDNPDTWVNVTIAEGTEVAAIEDVAIGDINGDGWLDLVAACEEAHLLYVQNPGRNARTAVWPRTIPAITQGRGSWLRAFITDVDGDGRQDVLAANKGAADIIDPSHPSAARPTSLLLIDGDPLQQSAWQEQVLSREVVPNTAMPVDIDNDGDPDVLAAARQQLKMTILENTGADPGVGITVRPHPIAIAAGYPVPAGWKGASNAFQSAFGDLDGDGRLDLVVSVYETPPPYPGSPLISGFGWLQQPATLDQPWTYYRIGDTLPDMVTGIALADIDGDGDLDAVTGGYSGLNIVAGAYSGASRAEDTPGVTAGSTVGRIAWFENPGDARKGWKRHDISRRVRGMYDGFIPRDMDGDGDVDFVSTRGNSGHFDGVFWLEQVRTAEPQPAFDPARAVDSRALPLPPEDWIDTYETEMTYIAPNKAEHD